MIKLFLFQFFCLVHLVCVNVTPLTKIKALVNKEIPAPILWTIDWSPNDHFFAVGGNDNLLRIYEATAFQLVKSYKLPAAIQCLDWNKNGKLLAIALDGFPVQLLNIETGHFHKLEGIPGSRALAWNNGGDLLAIGDYEGQLQIWNKAGKLLNTIKKDNSKAYLSVDWHPTKNIILTGDDKIRLFDTAGKILKTIKHRTAETIVLTVKWHPGGTFFATGDYGHKEEGIESLLQYWREDGTLIKSFSASKAAYRNIRWNKEGSLLATASDALRLLSKDGNIMYTGKSANLLWGLDWNNQDEKIITTSEKGTIMLWSNKAGLVKVIL